MTNGPSVKFVSKTEFCFKFIRIQKSVHRENAALRDLVRSLPYRKKERDQAGEEVKTNVSVSTLIRCS